VSSKKFLGRIGAGFQSPVAEYCTESTGLHNTAGFFAVLRLDALRSMMRSTKSCTDSKPRFMAVLAGDKLEFRRIM
jgi:hypothetical protein